MTNGIKSFLFSRHFLLHLILLERVNEETFLVKCRWKLERCLQYVWHKWANLSLILRLLWGFRKSRKKWTPHRSQVAVRFLLRTPLVGPRYEGPVAPLEHVFDVLKSEDTNCRLWTSGPEINQIAAVTSTSLRQIWDVLTWTGTFRNRANVLKLWVCFIWVNNDWPKTRTYTRSCWIWWFCCFRCHGYQISHTLKENVPKDAVQERISCQPSDGPVKTPLIFHCLF